MNKADRWKFWGTLAAVRVPLFLAWVLCVGMFVLYQPATARASSARFDVEEGSLSAKPAGARPPEQIARMLSALDPATTLIVRTIAEPAGIGIVDRQGNLRGCSADAARQDPARLQRAVSVRAGTRLEEMAPEQISSLLRAEVLAPMRSTRDCPASLYAVNLTGIRSLAGDWQVTGSDQDVQTLRSWLEQMGLRVQTIPSSTAAFTTALVGIKGIGGILVPFVLAIGAASVSWFFSLRSRYNSWWIHQAFGARRTDIFRGMLPPVGGSWLFAWILGTGLALLALAGLPGLPLSRLVDGGGVLLGGGWLVDFAVVLLTLVVAVCHGRKP